MSFITNKKGNAFANTLIIIVFLFVIAIGVGTVYKTFNEIAPSLIADFNATGHNQSARMLENNYNDFPSIWDGIFVFLLFGLWIAALIGSFMIDSHPIFFVIIMFILVPVLIVGVILSNTYDDFVADGSMTVLQTSFPMTYWAMTHFLVIAILIGTTIAIAMYAKNRFV